MKQERRPHEKQTPRLFGEHPPISAMEYYHLLCAHVWSFEKGTDNYYEFCKAARREWELLNMAMRAKEDGAVMVKDYYLVRRNAIGLQIQAAEAKLREQYKEEIEDALLTGDKEFDDFRIQVRRHDFWYSYSDDGNVWRAGEDQRQAIEKIVKEKGGIYATYWHYFNDEQHRRSAEAIAKQRAEREAKEY